MEVSRRCKFPCVSSPCLCAGSAHVVCCDHGTHHGEFEKPPVDTHRHRAAPLRPKLHAAKQWCRLRRIDAFSECSKLLGRGGRPMEWRTVVSIASQGTRKGVWRCVVDKSASVWERVFASFWSGEEYGRVEQRDQGRRWSFIEQMDS